MAELQWPNVPLCIYAASGPVLIRSPPGCGGDQTMRYRILDRLGLTSGIGLAEGWPSRKTSCQSAAPLVR